MKLKKLFGKILEKANQLQDKTNARAKNLSNQKKMTLVCLFVSFFYLLVMSNLYNNTFMDLFFYVVPPILIMLIPVFMFNKKKNKSLSLETKNKDDKENLFENLRGILNEY